MITYDNEIIKIFKDSEKEAIKLNHQYVGTEHIVLAILKNDNNIKTICNINNLNYTNFYNKIKKIKTNNNDNFVIYTPLLKRIIILSNKNNLVTLDSLFIKLLESGEGIAMSIMNNLNIDIKNIYNQVKNKNKISYGTNLNEIKNHENIIGREKELNEIIEVLCRKNKNNPILIGKAGVGKTAIIEELAYRIKKGLVPKELLNKQIISVNISELVSGTKYRGEFEEKLNKLIKEFESNKNLILFIDEIHTIVGAGGAEGAIDASNILKPSLARNNIKCIGATTIDEYNNTILKDKALNRRFYKIDIKEPNITETINILKNTKKYYEEYHNVKINLNQIKLIVNLSNKYVKDRFEPDRSLDILDKICTKAKLNHINNNNDIEEYIKEKEKFLKLKDFKSATIINNKIKLLSKSKDKIKIDNNLIKECFLISNNCNLGFKST